MHSLMSPVYYKRSCVWRLEDVRVRLAYNRLHFDINRLSLAPSRLCLRLVLPSSAGC